MPALLLIVIYLAFISLGLPDSVLGSAWPVIHEDLGITVSGAGIASMIVSLCTILSSLMSGRVICRLGTGKTTLFSVLLTALSLVGYSFTGSFGLLCLLAIPMGLGAGSVDTALNSFVALHYKAIHMNWLHCFWGVGATLGPMLMAGYLEAPWGWRRGFHLLGAIQLGLTAVLLLALPLWRSREDSRAPGKLPPPPPPLKSLLKRPGVKQVLLGFFCYCALESTAGLWASSYLVMAKEIDTPTAASWASLFYLGITLARFISGLVSLRLTDKAMIRLGQSLLLAGIGVIWLAWAPWMACLGLFLIGVGCAPIYPSIIHSTPAHFGKECSQNMVGLQMAFAYTGSTLMPPLLGALSGWAGIALWPPFLLALCLAMILCLEWMNRAARRQIEAD